MTWRYARQVTHIQTASLSLRCDSAGWEIVGIKPAIEDMPVVQLAALALSVDIGPEADWSSSDVLALRGVHRLAGAVESGKSTKQYVPFRPVNVSMEMSICLTSLP